MHGIVSVCSTQGLMQNLLPVHYQVEFKRIGMYCSMFADVMLFAGILRYVVGGTVTNFKEK